jgi:uncharacterized protein YndB with AHSA1/START domain
MNMAPIDEPINEPINEPTKNLGRLLNSNTLVLERHLKTTPEKLWQAVATKEGLAHWFMPTDIDIKPGGRFSFGGGWAGTITDFDPPRRIVYTPDESAEAFLCFEIEPTADGCLFRLTDRMGPTVDASTLFPDSPDHHKYQPGGIGTHWSGVISGYHGFVDALETHCTGVEISFDYDDMSKRYIVLMDQWRAESATR